MGSRFHIYYLIAVVVIVLMIMFNINNIVNLTDLVPIKILPENSQQRKQFLLYGLEMDYLKRQNYLKIEPFTFIKEYKNPCWLEVIPKDFLQRYQEAKFYSVHGFIKVSNLTAIYNLRISEGKPWRMRCLPYVYLAGVTKSGTTDFFDALIKHPDVHMGWVKEPMYWNCRRYPGGVNLNTHKSLSHIHVDEYLSEFDYAAHLINRSVIQTASGPWHNNIIVDGSSYLIWEDMGWQDNPGNEGLDEPVYTTAMALYAAQPQAKIIVLLRNPTDRVYSSFNMHKGRNSTPHGFHISALQAVNDYTDCSYHSSWRACFFDKDLYNKHFSLGLTGSMYAILVKDWVDVFPRNQMLIIKSEDYYSNRMTVMGDVFHFLHLDPLSEHLVKAVRNKKPSNSHVYQPMLNMTRMLLNDFFEPFNRKLENILENMRWT